MACAFSKTPVFHSLAGLGGALGGALGELHVGKVGNAGDDFLPTFLGMEAEILAPVATSPLDFARGRGNHRHRPIGMPHAANTVTTIRIEFSKERTDSYGSRTVRSNDSSSPKVGFHVQ